MDSLAHNLQRVQERIATAARQAGRDPATITLIAVTKTQPAALIKEVVALGLTHCGENRVQEAGEKFAGREEDGSPAQVARPGLTLHLIGPLQRNKAVRAAALFDSVDSVDRPELVAALDRARAATGGPPLPVLLEVNVSGEASKSGVAPAAVPALAEAVRAATWLVPRGLLTIAPAGAGEAETRRVFAGLRALRDSLAAADPQAGWTALSMGMSSDYEWAVLEGATEVRLGTTLFGARQG